MPKELLSRFAGCCSCALPARDFLKAASMDASTETAIDNAPKPSGNSFEI